MTNLEAWQQGIPLDRLRNIRGLFNRYKPYAFGRFGMPNEAEIAQMLTDDEAYELFGDDGTTVVAFMSGKTAKRNSIKQCFGDVELYVSKDDFQIKHLTFNSLISDSTLSEWLQQIKASTIWIETHAEDTEKLQQLERVGFKRLGSKVSASSELKSILIKTDNHMVRTNHPMSLLDKATLEKLTPTFVDAEMLQELRSDLENYVAKPTNHGWADHYSSYNLRKSWSAISLKGFTNDPEFIIKPAEMSKKWKENNAALMHNEVRPTEAWDSFPSVHRILQLLGCETQRVRLMRVRASDGGLSRHADITDKEAGATIGKIARLHIPIQTNPETRFMAWHLNGRQVQEHLDTGSLWYLDTRKPHAVSNQNGAQDRIHLVIDAVVNEALQDWIYGKVSGLL